MLREEDLIRHSGIIEYLEDRIKQYKEDLKIASICEEYTYKDIVESIIEELEENLNHFKDLCGKKYKLLWYIDENKKHHHIIFNTKEEMIGFIKEENLFLDELKQINKEDNVWCCFDFKELVKDE